MGALDRCGTGIIPDNTGHTAMEKTLKKQAGIMKNKNPMRTFENLLTLHKNAVFLRAKIFKNGVNVLIHFKDGSILALRRPAGKNKFFVVGTGGEGMEASRLYAKLSKHPQLAFTSR